MKKIILLLALLVTTMFSHAQETSPYTWDWKVDGPLLGLSLGGTTAGFLIIQSKEGFTEQEVQAFQNNIDDINFIDKWAAGNDNESANLPSDIFFYGSFLAPAVLFFDDETNEHTAQVLGMYLESMAVTSTLFTITAGLTNRARPYVYSTDFPLDEQLGTSATRSFFSGHVAATATATFFTAKVYSDFNPDSPALPYVWTGAAVVPALVGYFRIEAGQHFLTDVALGYTVGALSGYFIPELHKTDTTELSINATQGLDFYGNDYTGLAFSYTF